MSNSSSGERVRDISCAERYQSLKFCSIRSCSICRIFAAVDSSYHGSRIDQLRNTAARTSKVTSVATALPFWNSKPPTAGNKASASGTDCQCDSLSLSRDLILGLTRGRNRSSVEDFMELRASETVSEKVELRRNLPGPAGGFEDSSFNAVVAERLKGL